MPKCETKYQILLFTLGAWLGHFIVGRPYVEEGDSSLSVAEMPSQGCVQGIQPCGKFVWPCAQVQLAMWHKFNWLNTWSTHERPVDRVIGEASLLGSLVTAKHFAQQGSRIS